MDFTKIKKIEDLKKKSSELGAILSQRNKNNKKAFVEKTKSEFGKYFVEKGFEVTESDYSILAKYGEYNVSLSFNRINESYFGCVDIYNLSINQKSYKVIINKIGSEMKITSSVSSVSNDENAKLDYEIEKLQKDIDYAEEKIADKSIPNYGYMISDEDKKHGRVKEEYVQTIIELIESVK
jgi:hypothetical protein